MVAIAPPVPARRIEPARRIGPVRTARHAFTLAWRAVVKIRHNPEQLADDIVVLDHGTAIARGTPEELKAGVSGKVLEVRPVDAGRLGAVAAIVGDLVAVAPEVHVDTSMVTVPVSDSALLGEVVRRLEHAGIVLTDLSLRGPSLDEVFLALTGRRAEAEPAAKEEIAV